MTVLLWSGFILFVVTMLAIDLGVLNRKAHVVHAREALTWTGVCIVLALIFNVFVYFLYERQWFGVEPLPGGGLQAATEFFTGWLIEYTLSLDNIFVIALIFEYFRVPALYQHRVLFWGILGALVMRGAMIGIGAWLVQFHIVLVLFGLILIWSAVKMLRSGEEEIEPDRNPLVRIARRFFPVTPDYHESRFFVRLPPAVGSSTPGRLAMTPLFVALLVVEATDVLFAIDSIPAIFAITKVPFIVFTSNVFAILGLRSLYFALAVLLRQFRYLKVSLAFILAYVGSKMLVDAIFHYKIPAHVTLGVVAVILTVGVLASIRAGRTATPHPSHRPQDDESSDRGPLGGA
ncbi:MAG: TerC family protein [Phycisphaerales bacterium]|nr:TerC family protein [Phycisphaerales bacterium]